MGSVTNCRVTNYIYTISNATQEYWILSRYKQFNTYPEKTLQYQTLRSSSVKLEVATVLYCDDYDDATNGADDDNYDDYDDDYDDDDVYDDTDDNYDVTDVDDDDYDDGQHEKGSNPFLSEN